MYVYVISEDKRWNKNTNGVESQKSSEILDRIYFNGRCEILEFDIQKNR